MPQDFRIEVGEDESVSFICENCGEVSKITKRLRRRAPR